MKKRKLNVGKTLCVILAVATIIASPFGLANDWLESISIYHESQMFRLISDMYKVMMLLLWE